MSESPWQLMFHHGHGTLQVPERPQQQCIVGAAHRLAGIYGKGLCLQGRLASGQNVRLESDWLFCPFLLASLFSCPSRDQSWAEVHLSPKGRLIHSLVISLHRSLTDCSYSALFETPHHTRARYFFQLLFCKWENRRRMVMCPKKSHQWSFGLDYSIFPLPACYVPEKTTWPFLRTAQMPLLP